MENVNVNSASRDARSVQCAPPSAVRALHISKQEIEWDEDHEQHEQDADDEICIATKTDGNPCLGLKYKDTDFCYSHLTKMKMVPKVQKQVVDPTLLPKRGRPKKVQIAPVAALNAPGVAASAAPSASATPVAVVQQPVASSFSGAPPKAQATKSQSGVARRAQHISPLLGSLPSALAVASTLESKLMKKLKIKLDKLDSDTKMLLECLL